MALYHIGISSRQPHANFFSLWKPNARFQALPKAGATQERTLEAVACKPLLGNALARLIKFCQQLLRKYGQLSQHCIKLWSLKAMYKRVADRKCP
jgi:hypothetical protein